MTMDLQCSKCQGSMEEGFLPEYAHPTLLVTRWYPGAPREAEVRVLGMKVGEWLDVHQDKMRLVSTYRCTGCGYLESYAK